ncbi:unnamed protein product [Cylicocyclus nassatus]|uniref:Uncharacterized protein n=1 Tax=Cylicocyclus nassatus TaxID=53992 RepID=A0AA36H4D8_CYLNA|nr:unnamed protein product [Cylicocyclus nassatus]
MAPCSFLLENTSVDTALQAQRWNNMDYYEDGNVGKFGHHLVQIFVCAFDLLQPCTDRRNQRLRLKVIVPPMEEYGNFVTFMSF